MAMPFDLDAFLAASGPIPGVLTRDSGRPGPHVLINALTHGNEPCGLAAIDWVLRERPPLLSGRLTLVLANIDAHRLHDPAAPASGRALDEDLNRIWAPDLLAAPAASRERARAAMLHPVYGDADILLDIHSMATPGRPLLLYHRTPRAAALLPRLRADQDRLRFEAPVHDGILLIEQAPFLDDAARAAFVIECGQHGRPETDRYARDFAISLLAAAGLIATPAAEPSGAAPHRVKAVSMLHAEGDDFRWHAPMSGFEEVAPDAPFAADSVRAYRAPFAGCVIALPRRAPRRGQEAAILAIAE